MESQKKIKYAIKILQEILKLTYHHCDHDDVTISTAFVSVNKKAYDAIKKLKDVT